MSRQRPKLYTTRLFLAETFVDPSGELFLRMAERRSSAAGGAQKLR